MLKFNSIPAFYAAAGVKNIGATSLEHFFAQCGQDVEALNALLANPEMLSGRTFPTGGRVGSRADIISRSFLERKAMLDQHALWVKVEEPVAMTQGDALKFAVAGKSFCFTGAGPDPRPVLAARIKAAGGMVHESVSAKTDYLVMGDKNSVSGKAKKAQSAGTTLLNYEDVF